MENQVNNANGQINSDAEALEALFDKYKKRDEKKKRLSKEEMLAKYFNPRKETEYFRALPKLAGEELIEEGWFHKVQAGKFLTNSTALYCPAKNNPKVQAKDKDGVLQFDQNQKPVMVSEYCPMCAKSAKMRSKMDKSISGKKKEQLTTAQEKAAFERNKQILMDSNKFEAKLYYIIRGIDRGAEKDGVKFWRFKHNFKSQGVHDKLWKPIINEYYKATGKVYNDVTNGIDLAISVIDNTIPGSTRTFKDVSAINVRMGGSTPLHSDSMIARQWLDDKTTWREVFKPKKAPGITELKFLELAAEEREVGQTQDYRNTPYYNEEEKKWVFPNHPDLEAAANTRNQNLDATDEMNVPDEEGYVSAVNTVMNQQSPDITQMSTAAPSTNAPTPQSMGAVQIGTPTQQVAQQPVAADPYGDLPF
jgi:hypothetical protein